jgi:hypothetical protein
MRNERNERNETGRLSVLAMTTFRPHDEPVMVFGQAGCCPAFRAEPAADAVHECSRPDGHLGMHRCVQGCWFNVTEMFVLWSLQHDMWWRPGGEGYTSELEQAGGFSESEASNCHLRSLDGWMTHGRAPSIVFEAEWIRKELAVMDQKFVIEQRARQTVPDWGEDG